MQLRSKTLKMVTTATSTSTTNTATNSGNRASTATTTIAPHTSTTSTTTTTFSRSHVPPSEPLSRPVFERMPMPAETNTNIESWFTSMEYWFDTTGIFLEQQRCATVLAAIDPNVLTQLHEMICAAPAIGKYDFIRQKLIDHYADSEQRKLNRLLSEMPLGDKRPSELYHDMKRVAGNVLGEAGLWAQRLPEAARPVVAASTGSATEFTRIADSIVDVHSPRTVNQVVSNPLNDVSELRTMINELKAKIDQNSRSRSHSRKRNSNFGHRRSQTPSSRSNSNNRNGNDNNGNGNDGECWYHATYGSTLPKPM